MKDHPLYKIVQEGMKGECGIIIDNVAREAVEWHEQDAGCRVEAA